MGRLNDMVGNSKPKDYQEVVGTFCCQTCDAWVNSARFYQLEEMLVWDCQEGHRSHIKEFKVI